MIETQANLANRACSVTVAISCAIQADKLDLARRELAAVIETVLAREPACHGIRVHENPKDPRLLLIIEHWDSEEAFTGPHMQTAHMQAFRRTAEDFLDGVPRFDFWREITRAV